MHTPRPHAYYAETLATLNYFSMRIDASSLMSMVSCRSRLQHFPLPASIFILRLLDFLISKHNVSPQVISLWYSLHCFRCLLYRHFTMLHISAATLSQVSSQADTHTPASKCWLASIGSAICHIFLEALIISHFTLRFSRFSLPWWLPLYWLIFDDLISRHELKQHSDIHYNTFTVPDSLLIFIFVI